MSARIGTAGGDRVVIDVRGRMHPDATDYWDGNWLFSPIEVQVGGFTAKIGAGLRAEELRSFREGLELLHRDLRGFAALTSMEDWLELSVTVSGSGRLEVVGEVIDRVGDGNRLAFRVNDLDQTHLPDLIGELRELESLYPVIGAP